MNTQFVTSADGTKIAYDVTGEGEAVLLLHGGLQSKEMWHQMGYVNRLKNKFKVITLDLRGHGVTEKPTDAAAYTTAKLGEDILAVADACGVESFSMWGYSYGGNIARYLASESDRINKLLMIGIPFGLGASGEFRKYIENFNKHWTAIFQKLNDGNLDKDTLSKPDKMLLSMGDAPIRLAWMSAMLDWRAVEPADLRCPTLWLMGSKNQEAMDSLKEYEPLLQSSKVQAQVIEGLTHAQEFANLDLPLLTAFTKG